MAYGNDILHKLSSIDIEKEMEEVVARIIDYIADLNRWQLSRGLNRDGEWLPRYVDDPYFKTLKQALGYQKWKKGKSPNTMKPVDIMDFYINGYSHSHINANVVGPELDIFMAVPWAAEIDQKTNNKAMGLSPESREEAWDREIQPHLVERIRDKMRS